jgi:hypothetical protein
VSNTIYALRFVVHNEGEANNGSVRLASTLSPIYSFVTLEFDADFSVVFGPEFTATGLIVHATLGLPTFVAEYQDFVLAVRDSLRSIQVDLRYIVSYTVLPGSIVVGLVGTHGAIAQIERSASEDLISLTYQGTTFKLLKQRTTSTVITTTDLDDSSRGLVIFNIILLFSMI